MKKAANTPYYVFDTTSPCTNARSCDCVVRSISLAMHKSWEEVYDDLYKIGRKLHRMPNEDNTYERYLKENGWVCIGQPRKENNTKYNGIEYLLSKTTVKKDAMILHVGSHHVSCILDGKFHDIWNCTGYTVGKIWIKQ